jgi:hypothetical protein
MRRPSPALLLLGAGLVLWGYLGLVTLWSPSTVGIAVWAVLGAFLVPTALVLALARRASSPVLPRAVLLRAMLLGGVLAAALGGPVLDALQTAVPSPFLGFLLASASQQAILAVLMVAIAWRLPRTGRVGRYVGAAVGAGYAGFAALGAILEAHTAFGSRPLPAAVGNPMLIEAGVTLQSAVLAPVGYPVWTALLGSALLAALNRASGARPPLKVAAALAFVVLTDTVVHAGFVVTGGVLGTSSTALIVQTFAALALSLPAALVLRSLGRRESGRIAVLAITEPATLEPAVARLVAAQAGGA